MCGRKTLFSSSQTIKKQFNIDKWEHEKEYNPSFNIAPTLESQVIVYKKQPTIKQMRWGFGFVKGYKPLFNARIETLNKKISFRNLINGHRCIVISDGYYEWKSIEGKKIPYFVFCSDKSIMPMAGLCKWDVNEWGEKKLVYTIITKKARNELKDIHHREPMVLDEAGYHLWINNEKIINDPNDFTNYSYRNISYRKVSSYVNSVKNNDIKCLGRI